MAAGCSSDQLRKWLISVSCGWMLALSYSAPVTMAAFYMEWTRIYNVDRTLVSVALSVNVGMLYLLGEAYLFIIGIYIQHMFHQICITYIYKYFESSLVVFYPRPMPEPYPGFENKQGVAGAERKK